MSKDEVARILHAMRMAYGAKFDRQWESVGKAEMLAFWHDRLHDIPDYAAKRALDDLLSTSPFPPTLPEFYAMCRQHIRQVPPAISISFAAPRNSAAALNGLRSMREMLRQVREEA